MTDTDDAILALIPHRPPMLLIHELIEVSTSASSAIVHVNPGVPFFQDPHGVPTAVGVEYMGQSAALIAGHQQQQGQLTEHLGFLLGVRDYQVMQSFFAPGVSLRVSCRETAVVGNGLARFDCSISELHSDQVLGTGKLSVFRQPLDDTTPPESLKN